MLTATTATGYRIQRLTDALVKSTQPDGREQLALIRQTATAVHDAFTRERFALVSAILAGDKIKSVPHMELKLYDVVRKLRDSLAQPIVAGVRAALGLGISRTDRDLLINTTFTLRNKIAEEYVKNVAGLRILGISDHTRTVVRAIVSDGITRGASPRDIADRIFRQGNAGGVFSRYRAEMIARNEIGNAYIHAQVETARTMGASLGLEQEKMWISAGDDRVDDTCLQAESDGWIPLDQNFSNGFDAPPDHVNCRCVLQLRVVDR